MDHVLSVEKEAGFLKAICFSCEEQENEAGVAMQTTSVACASTEDPWTFCPKLSESRARLSLPSNRWWSGVATRQLGSIRKSQADHYFLF
jgi:hypothetical protein